MKAFSGALLYNDLCQETAKRDFLLGVCGTVSSVAELGLIVGTSNCNAGDGLVWNENRDIGVFASGEIFSDLSEFLGTTVGVHQNEALSMCLLNLYEKAGISSFSKLNGWFRGGVVDRRKGSLVLFNDRYGIGQIYFHQATNGFYFSSEAKVLLRALPETRSFDFGSLCELISCSAVLQNRSLYKGIELLPPASCWIFTPPREVQKLSYFKKEDWENRPILNPSQYQSALSETWERVLPRYFRGGAKIGLSLTGGVDSRMILAWARQTPGSFPCYTFGGRYRECEDVKIARQVAEIAGQSFQVIPVEEEFLRGFPKSAEQTVYISDGRMDVSGAIDLYVQQPISAISPVRMTGTNGGEILRRLVAFKPTQLKGGFLQNDLSPVLDRVSATYLTEKEGHQLSFTAFKQAPWYMNSKFIVEREHLTLRMPYFDNDLVALSYQAPPELATCNDSALRLISDGNPRLGRVGTDRGVGTTFFPGFTAIRHAVKQFTFKAEYAYDYGMPPWLARLDSFVSPLRLERLFLGRHKFHHFRVYYRDELAPFLKDVLLDPSIKRRPYLNAKAVEKMVLSHTRGTANYTLELHKLLTIELIERTLLSLN
jgi:asparagine synthase (glutamine-hydrolysing)